MEEPIPIVTRAEAKTPIPRPSSVDNMEEEERGEDPELIHGSRSNSPVDMNDSDGYGYVYI